MGILDVRFLHRTGGVIFCVGHIYCAIMGSNVLGNNCKRHEKAIICMYIPSSE